MVRRMILVTMLGLMLATTAMAFSFSVGRRRGDDGRWETLVCLNYGKTKYICIAFTNPRPLQPVPVGDP